MRGELSSDRSSETAGLGISDSELEMRFAGLQLRARARIAIEPAPVTVQRSAMRARPNAVSGGCKRMIQPKACGKTDGASKKAPRYSSDCTNQSPTRPTAALPSTNTVPILRHG